METQQGRSSEVPGLRWQPYQRGRFATSNSSSATSRLTPSDGKAAQDVSSFRACLINSDQNLTVSA